MAYYWVKDIPYLMWYYQQIRKKVKVKGKVWETKGKNNQEVRV